MIKLLICSLIKVKHLGNRFLLNRDEQKEMCILHNNYLQNFQSTDFFCWRLNSHAPARNTHAKKKNK